MNEMSAVKQLLERGALPHLTNGLNLTASHLATQEDIRSILQKHMVPLLRSILRQECSCESDLSNRPEKKKVTFNESAEIRQFIELSSDEEEPPKRRRRNIFMMENYNQSDGSSEEEEEELEEMKQVVEDDEEDLDMQETSDDLDILARLQEEMHAMAEYEDTENYDWEQFESETEDDQHELQQDATTAELPSSSKRMDLEQDISQSNVDADDRSLINTLQAVTSISTDSLWKELIASPEIPRQRSTGQMQICEQPGSDLVEQDHVAMVQFNETIEEPDSESAREVENERDDDLVEAGEVTFQVVPVQKACEEKFGEEELCKHALRDRAIYEHTIYTKTPPARGVLEEDLLESASPKQTLTDDTISESTASESIVHEKAVTEQAGLEESLPEQAVSEQYSPELVVCEKAFPEQQSLSLNDSSVDASKPDLETAKLPSNESLQSEQSLQSEHSFISSASDSSNNQRSQVKGSQRMRWESDIMSPVDTESPMSFAAIFAANKPKPEPKGEPKSYIDLIVANDESEEDTQPTESMSVNDISVKPLPAIPSADMSAAKRITGIFHKLSDKRRIAPAMNGLKQISIPNLKRLSLEHATMRRSSSATTTKESQPVVETVLPQANTDSQPKRSKSLYSSAGLTKHFAKNRSSSGDNSDNSDSSNLFENDSQTSGSQYDTPPSSPSPTGSFEDEEKRLSAARKNSVRRRQSMPSFTSTNVSAKSATRYQEPLIESVQEQGSASKRLSVGCDTDLSTKKYVLDVPERSHATAFVSTMQESLERISEGQKPKRYTERYQQDVIHLSNRVSFSPQRSGSGSPSWKAAQDQNKGGTFTKSRQRSAANSTRSPKDIPGKLYVRLVTVQDVNVPIPSEPTYVRCILNDGTYEHLSKYVMLRRNMQFDQEFKITANSRLDFSLSLHVRADSHVKPKAAIARLLSSHKKMTPELSTFVNRQDGAIGTTRISFGDMIDECRSKLCSATFPCQNDWVVDISRAIDKVDTSKPNPKTVGKLVLHMVYIPGTKDRHMVSTLEERYGLMNIVLICFVVKKYPRDIDECMRGFDARRWHENVWREGYMSQIGGDVNVSSQSH